MVEERIQVWWSTDAVNFTRISRNTDSLQITEHEHHEHQSIGKCGSLGATSVPPPNFLRFHILQHVFQLALHIICQLFRHPWFHFVKVIDTGDLPRSASANRSPLSVVDRIVEGHDPPHANPIFAFLGWVFQQSFDPGVCFDYFRAWDYHGSAELLVGGADRIRRSQQLGVGQLTWNALAASGLCVSCMIITKLQTRFAFRSEALKGATCSDSPMGLGPLLAPVIRQIKSPHGELLKQPAPNVQPVRQQFLPVLVMNRARIHCVFVEDVGFAGPFMSLLPGLLLAFSRLSRPKPVGQHT